MSQLEPLGKAGRAVRVPDKPELTDLAPFSDDLTLARHEPLSWIFGAFSRRWKLMTAVFCTMLAAVVAVTLVAGQNYESEFKILVKQRVDPMASVDAGGNQARSVPEEEINSEVSLLKSRELLAKVVEIHHLDAASEYPWSVWIARLQSGSQEVTPQMRADKAVRRLASNLRVEAVKKSDIIEVAYSSSNPTVAAAVLKTLAELYLAKHVELQQNPGAYDFFAVQADQWKAALAKAEDDLTEFSHAHDTGAPQQERDAMIQKMADMRALQAQKAAAADAAIERYKNLQASLADTKPRVVTQVRSVDNAHLLGDLKTTLLTLQNKRTELTTKFAPTYPEVTEVDKQIAQTQHAIDAETTNPMTENSTDQNPTYQWLEGELAKVQAEMAALHVESVVDQRNLTRTEGQVMKLGDASITSQSLLRAVQTAADNYNLYQQKGELARIANELNKRQISNVVLAEEPVPSALPVRSSAVTIAMGALLCLIVSSGVGFAADYLDPRFRTWMEVAVSLNVPVLATLPVSTTESLPLQHRLEIEPGTETMGV